MKILFIGEIVAEPGRKAVRQVLPEVIDEYSPDLILSNAENSAAGRGITKDILKELQDLGINYFTSGDHVFWQRDTDDMIDDAPIVRPANYPDPTPGKGYTVIDTGKNGSVLLINLMGRTGFTSLSAYLDDPFRKADEILKEFEGQDFSAKIVDFHAESSSEKYSLGFYLDGRVDIFVGSHTHIPSADGFIMPKGTMYLTDVGMTGIIDSVLGVKTEIITKMFLTARNQRFDWETSGRKAFRSVLFDTQQKTITRLDKML